MITTLMFLNNEILSINSKSITLLKKIEEYLYPYMTFKKDSTIRGIHFEMEISRNTDAIDFFNKNKACEIEIHGGQKALYIKESNLEYIYIYQTNLILIVNKKTRLIKISGDFLKNNLTFTDLLRIFRGISMGELQTKGYFKSHGAALNIHNKNFLILGEKGAGKTSFITTALMSQKYNASLISNDKLMINSNGSTLGLPYAVPFSASCLSDCPQLEKISIDKEINHFGKLFIWPNEFVEAFNRSLYKGGEIDAIILPKLNLNTASIEVRECSFSDNIFNLFIDSNDKMDTPWIYPFLNIHVKNNEKNIQAFYSKKCFIIEGNPWKCDWFYELLNYSEIRL